MLSKVKKAARKIIVITGILLFIGLLGFLFCFKESRAIRFERYELPVCNLPSEWEGKKLIQISDVHASRYVDQKFIRQVFERVNEENPDIIVMTGDYISGNYSYLKPFQEEAGKLRAGIGNAGKIAILGNHDCRNLKKPIPSYDDCEISEEQLKVMASLEAAGFTVLLNERVELGDKDKLIIAGLGDLWAKQTKPKEALKDLDCTGKPIIVLMHNPLLFPYFAKRGNFTVLAGHTHGGQVLFPYKYELLRKKVKYLNGFYREKGSIMYVSRGMGVSIAPARLNCPPEITVFTLVPGNER